MANSRTDEDYEIESVSKSLAVLEIVVEKGPIREPKVVKLSELSRDTVMRTLRTLRLRGYVTQNPLGEWMTGPRMIRLAQDI